MVYKVGGGSGEGRRKIGGVVHIECFGGREVLSESKYLCNATVWSMTREQDWMSSAAEEKQTGGVEPGEGEGPLKAGNCRKVCACLQPSAYEQLKRPWETHHAGEEAAEAAICKDGGLRDDVGRALISQDDRLCSSR